MVLVQRSLAAVEAVCRVGARCLDHYRRPCSQRTILMPNKAGLLNRLPRVWTRKVKKVVLSCSAS